MANIGFIGLGHMGFPMAQNLLQAGHQVSAYDAQPAVLEKWARLNGHPASNLQEAAQEKDLVITMLQTGEQVLSVCQGETGLFASAAKGTLFIDSSSIDSKAAQAFHLAAQDHGLLSLDAPVSGGVSAATAGTLTFMVGGEESTYQAALPLLSVMGKKIIHTGQAGSGQTAKICNNLILGISMIALAEAFTLAEHAGLSAAKLFEVASHSSGQCWALNHYIPVPDILADVPANNNYQPGFTSAMMLKDLKLSQKAAQHHETYTPLATKATALYEELVNQGFGEADFSIIIKLIASHLEN